MLIFREILKVSKAFFVCISYGFGANLSWDELVCVGYPVTEEAVDKLCRDIYDHMIKGRPEDEIKDIPRVGIEQLFF